MSIRKIGLQDALTRNTNDPWVLVLGGVTRVGDRRARRAVEAAMDGAHDVVWFDGFERIDDKAGVDDLFIPTGHRELLIVGFRNAERRLLANRIEKPFGRTARRRKFRNRVIRRGSTAIRNYRNWLLLKSSLKSLSGGPPPAQIIWCDDFSLSAAWHVAKVWQSATVAMEFSSE